MMCGVKVHDKKNGIPHGIGFIVIKISGTKLRTCFSSEYQTWDLEKELCYYAPIL